MRIKLLRYVVFVVELPSKSFLKETCFHVEQSVRIPFRQDDNATKLFFIASIIKHEEEIQELICFRRTSNWKKEKEQHGIIGSGFREQKRAKESTMLPTVPVVQYCTERDESGECYSTTYYILLCSTSAPSTVLTTVLYSMYIRYMYVLVRSAPRGGRLGYLQYRV